MEAIRILNVQLEIEENRNGYVVKDLSYGRLPYDEERIIEQTKYGSIKQDSRIILFK